SSADGSRDVPGGGVSVRSGELLPRRARQAESPGFQPLEPLVDGLLDERGQVAVWNLGKRECSKPLQLVTKLGSGRELDLVPSRREWLEGGDGCRTWDRRQRWTDNVVWAGFKTRHLDPIQTVWSGGQLPDDRGSVRPGSQLCDELGDLALGLVD